MYPVIFCQSIANQGNCLRGEEEEEGDGDGRLEMGDGRKRDVFTSSVSYVKIMYYTIWHTLSEL